jgi:hypothetical protein
MSRDASESPPVGPNDAPGPDFLDHGDPDRMIGPFATGHPLRFAVGVLAGALAIIAVVVAFNVTLDPYGYVGSSVFPTAILSDRATKACLAERLHTAPRLVVLGSSRAMKVDPRYLTTRTGLPAFNAAVSSGSPADAWAFANFMHDRFPAAHQRVLWLLDVEAFRSKPLDPGLMDTPALSRYFSSGSQLRARLGGAWTLLSWHTAQDSWRVLDATISGKASAATPVPCTYRTNGVTEYSPRGFRRWDFHDLARQRGTSLAASIGGTVAQYRAIYRTGYPTLSRTAEGWFQHTVAALNTWGERPVVVLTPVQPRLLRAIGPIGWNRRHAEVVRYLEGLRRQYGFDLLDASRISTFGGSSTAFYDGVHMTVPNVRLLVNWALRNDRGTLRS